MNKYRFLEEERPQGDSISREALKKKFERLVDETIPYGGVAVNDMRDLIDNAPTVSDRYDEGYAQGYIDGSTGADWKGGAE